MKLTGKAGICALWRIQPVYLTCTSETALPALLPLMGNRSLGCCKRTVSSAVALFNYFCFFFDHHTYYSRRAFGRLVVYHEPGFRRDPLGVLHLRAFRPPMLGNLWKSQGNLTELYFKPFWALLLFLAVSASPRALLEAAPELPLLHTYNHNRQPMRRPASHIHRQALC